MNTLKDNLSSTYRHYSNFIFFLIHNSIISILMLFLLLLTFSRYAFSTGYYVDSEVVINIPGTTYNWLEIGRFGLVAFRKLLGTQWYNPFYTGVLFFVFLWLAGMALTYLFMHVFPALDKRLCALAALAVITYPTFADQYYFHFQSAEIALGLFLCVCTMGACFLFLTEANLFLYCITIPALVLVFATYQSFVPFMLCGYLLVFLGYLLHAKKDLPEILAAIGKIVLHFVLAFGLYEGINKLFFTSSDYIVSQVIWESGYSAKQILLDILTNCARMLAGLGVFYTAIMIPAWIFCMFLFIKVFRKKLEMEHAVWKLFTAAGIAVTPFLLTFIMGSYTNIRTQFTYSLSAVILLLFCIQTLAEAGLWEKLLSKAALAGMLFVAVSQICIVNYIWNVHEKVLRFDYEAVTNILGFMYDSYIVCDQGPCLFWGYMQPELENAKLLSQSPSYLFTSVFNLEHDMEPYCYYSSVRITAYMESLGHTFTYPTDEFRGKGRYFIDREELPPYPDLGCYYSDPAGFILNLGNSPDYYN